NNNNMVLPAKIYSALTRCSAQATSCAIASLTPLRYPIPNPTAQPAATPPKMVRQIRATSSAQTIDASAERNQVIYWARTDPTTNRLANHARGPDANPSRSLGRPARKTGGNRAGASFPGLGSGLPVPIRQPKP